MPERSFGRTVRYRRTKLGLSQAKLAELVGRSTPTIRSWERDKSRPNDPQVLAALAAILGVDERQLFDKVELDRPVLIETSPTVEQALASLSVAEFDPGDQEPAAEAPVVATALPTEDFQLDLVEVDDGEDGDGIDESSPSWQRDLAVAAAGGPTPAFVAPPDPYVQTPLTPTLADASYIEDESQRQVYRVRNLATVVAVIALVIAFIWALGEGLGALGDWWDTFIGNLRL